MTLVPSENMPVPHGTGELLAELAKARAENRRLFEVEKFVGMDRQGKPDYPKVILRAQIGYYGQPVASVSIRRTRTAYTDFIGSLKDLDVRVACAYYVKLDSVEAIDAVEKVLHAPTPKAIALVALLDSLALGPALADQQAEHRNQEQIETKQEVIDV